VIDPPLDVLNGVACVSLIPAAVEVLGCAPNLDDQIPDKSSGSTSPRFSRQRRISELSSLPMIIRASEPPMKLRLRAESVITLFRVSIAFLGVVIPRRRFHAWY
jgi:hypothetical protein